VLHTCIVNKITRREVVRAINDEIAVFDEAFDVSQMHVRDVRLDLHVRVDFIDATRARHRFRHAFARIAFGEHRLPL
jgi:hypothetical protein